MNKLMPQIILSIVLVSISSFSAIAREPEKWIKYTCHGPVTPKGKTPVKFADILVAHFRVTQEGIPSAKKLYEMNAPRFQAITDLCSERRWEQTDLTGWNGNAGRTSYLDWETDLLYERYTMSMVTFQPKYGRRGVGYPCDDGAPCVQSSGEKVICHPVTHTCEVKKE